jgi:hypothetical protein
MDDLADVIVVEVPEARSLNIDQIRLMIAECGKTEDGESLKRAMNELKAALKANPAACAMMLPEDVGACSQYLRKMTNKLILDDIHGGGKERAKKEKVVIDQNILDGLSVEDLM